MPVASLGCCRGFPCALCMDPRCPDCGCSEAGWVMATGAPPPLRAGGFTVILPRPPRHPSELTMLPAALTKNAGARQGGSARRARGPRGAREGSCVLLTRGDRCRGWRPGLPARLGGPLREPTEPLTKGPRKQLGWGSVARGDPQWVLHPRGEKGGSEHTRAHAHTGSRAQKGVRVGSQESRRNQEPPPQPMSQNLW